MPGRMPACEDCWSRARGRTDDPPISGIAGPTQTRTAARLVVAATFPSFPVRRKKGSTIRACSCWLDFLAPVHSHGVHAFEFSPAALLAHAPPRPHPLLLCGFASPLLSYPLRVIKMARSEDAQHGSIRVCHAPAPTRVSWT
jgi:hypothetical protein